MRSSWIVGLAAWGVGLVLISRGAAFVLTGQDWSYQAAPMGEPWIVCGTSVPGSGVQRTKDGAAGWNYDHFTFQFGADACRSSGLYPWFNNVNQVDIGGGLSTGVLAATTSWFLTSNPSDVLECDMRLSSRVSWYTGTGAPPSTQYDWQSVAIHEMGHCLGLGHQDGLTPTPVMAPTFMAGEVRRTLTADDSAGRNAIYGEPRGPLTPMPDDYDGDGYTDLVLRDPQSSTWYILPSSTGQLQTRQFGWAALTPVPGDYDGDGKIDFALRDPQSSTWYISFSSTGQVWAPQFGWGTLVPVPGDYDGDGRTDLALLDPEPAIWYILLSRTGQLIAPQFGWAGLVPVPKDYDGDGSTDIAVYDPQSSTWHIQPSSTGQLWSAPFGWSALVPVSGDYDGDGRADIAVRDPASSSWYIQLSQTNQLWAPQFGWSALVPIPGDYDGDGATDLALFDPQSSTWYIQESSTGQLRTIKFG